MCGIYARLAYFTGPCTMGKIYGQLLKLRHRGNDGMGIALEHNDRILCIRNPSIDSFPTDRKECGNMGIGHVRYRTRGSVNLDNCQPLVYKNIALVHNGHIQDSEFNPDSKLLLSYFEQYPEKSVFDIVTEIMEKIPNGSYSCVVMIVGFGLITFRDPRGIRPLVYNRNDDRTIIASESIVITQHVRDIEPGECIIFHKDGNVSQKRCAQPNYTPCIFEYIYFAHKNSYINRIYVYRARQILGELLSSKINPKNYDLVVPVPKTSCVSAKELSRRIDVPYEEILTVRRGRSFILPKQTIRVNLINEKFSIDEEKCKGKRILLVDDSIVRGTTMCSLVKHLRIAGVKKIDIASCAPPVYSPNKYGIDISSPNELIANKVNSIEEVAILLGADQIFYQDLKTMCSALLKLNKELKGWECSMFKKN